MTTHQDAVPRAPLRSPAHDLVGGIPEILGPWQLDWLRARGLAPDHLLLDLGCGTLRFGLLALEYLVPGHYFGAEPDQHILRSGRTLAADSGTLQRAGAVEDLEWLDAQPSLEVDFALTQSVLNHLDADRIEQTAARVARHLSPGGVWLGTAAFDDDIPNVAVGAPHPQRPGEHVQTRMHFEWFAGVLAGHGLVLEFDPIVHPRGLSGFVARRAEKFLRPRLELLLAELVSIDSFEGATGSSVAASLVAHRLAACSLDVEVLGSDGTPPLVVARRSAAPGSPVAALVYGHYDVETPGQGWTSPPLQLTAREERLFGLGVGDNKGPLAARLVATELASSLPELCWVVQGEEESGCGALRTWMQTPPLARWWIDESGWWIDRSTQRVLAGAWTDGGLIPLAREEASSLRRGLLLSATGSTEVRRLNKHLVPGGCAFLEGLPDGARYLSVGPNDPATRIHRPDESVSSTNLVQHALQWRTLLAWLNGVRW